MIGRIQGTLVSVHPPRLLVDCQGIGYEVDVPMSTLYQLPQAGQKLRFLRTFKFVKMRSNFLALLPRLNVKHLDSSSRLVVLVPVPH